MTQSKKVPHVHAELIKAWADGAEIECRMGPRYMWREPHEDPVWNPKHEYRIKPKPLVKKYLVAFKMTNGHSGITAVPYTSTDEFMNFAHCNGWFTVWTELIQASVIEVEE